MQNLLFQHCVIKVYKGERKNQWRRFQVNKIKEGRKCFLRKREAPWRNGLACWTSKSKVVGLSPPGGAIFSLFGKYSKSLVQTVESFFFSVNIDVCQR